MRTSRSRPRTPASHRPITLLFARTADLDGVRDAFVSRRTAAWKGDEVWGAEEHLRGLWSGAIVVETPALVRKSGAAPVLKVRNTSAIPMRVAVRQAPPWLVLVPPIQLEAETLTIVIPASCRRRPANIESSCSSRSEHARRSGTQSDGHGTADGAKVETCRTRPSTLALALTNPG